MKMRSCLYFLLDLCLISSVLSFPPTPPDSYTAEIQYSFEGEFFVSKDAKVKGVSLYAVENVDTIQKRADINWHTESQFEGEYFSYSKRFLWNPNITIAKNYVVYEYFHSPFLTGRIKTCSADPEIKESVEEILLGFSNNKPSMPSIDGLLYFGEDTFTEADPETINQIPCKKYVKQIKETFGAKYNIEADVTLYWSDPENWHGSAGKNRPVPVFASIKGKIDNKEANIFMTYVDYYEASHDSAFRLVPDLTCKDMVGERVPVPVVDDRFMYEGEFLVHFYAKGKMLKYILPTVEYYDFTDHVSVHEYKTIAFSKEDPFPQSAASVRDVIDFQSGLAYKTNLLYGNCSVSPVEMENSYGDIVLDEHGHIQLMTPGEFWGVDKEHFVIKGFQYRGLESSSFLYHEKRMNQVVSTYFDFTEKTRPVPIRILSYPHQEYNFITKHRELNIFGYQSNPNYEFPTDVTHCFPGKSQTHRILATSWIPEMTIFEKLRFTKEVVRRTLARAAQIIYFRVQNMEVLKIDEDKKVIHFVFTILDKHPKLNTTNDYSEEVTNSLETALDNLHTAMREEKLVFHFEGNEGKIFKSVPVPDSFVETTRDKTPEPTYSLKYSSGSMAALGIFMALFGIIGGLFSYHYYLKSPFAR